MADDRAAGSWVPLGEIAKFIRSKNAGPFRLTFDVLFEDQETYERVRGSGALSAERIAEAYGVAVSRISSIHAVDMARAFKITFLRPVDQCAIGETDSYGCQQHAPLMTLLAPAPEKRG